LKWLESLFRQRSKNVAIDRLYRQQKSLDAGTEEILQKIPQMAEAIRQGESYLYEKVLVDLFQKYDIRFGLTSLMLFQFFNELAERYPDTAIPSSLTDALHFEIYGSLPSKESFIDYLSYRNPNFENPQAAPAFKFGNDVAEILRTLDTSFSFMVAQQFPVIRDISKKLIRLVLFNEPIEDATAPP
jgi:hypothetical protein